MSKTPKEPLILDPLQGTSNQRHPVESSNHHQGKKHHKRFWTFFAFLIIFLLIILNTHFFIKCTTLETQQQLLTKEMVALTDLMHQTTDSMSRDIKINVADIRGKISSLETKAAPSTDKEALLEMIKTQIKELPKETTQTQNSDQKTTLSFTAPHSITCAFFVKAALERGTAYENILKLLQNAIEQEKIPLAKVQSFMDVLMLQAKKGVITRIKLQEALPSLDLTTSFLPPYLDWLNDFVKISSSNSSNDLKEKVILALSANNVKEAVSLIKTHLEISPNDTSLWNSWLESAILFQTNHEALDQLINTLINHYVTEERK